MTHVLLKYLAIIVPHDADIIHAKSINVPCNCIRTEDDGAAIGVSSVAYSQNTQLH